MSHFKNSFFQLILILLFTSKCINYTNQSGKNVKYNKNIQTKVHYSLLDNNPNTCFKSNINTNNINKKDIGKFIKIDNASLLIKNLNVEIDLKFYKLKFFQNLDNNKISYFAIIQSRLPNLHYNALLPVYFENNTDINTFLKLDKISQKNRINICKEKDFSYIIISKHLPGGFWGFITGAISAVVSPVVNYVAKKAEDIINKIYDIQKDLFSALTYPFAFAGDQIYKLFNESEAVKRLRRQKAQLEKQIIDLNISDLNQKQLELLQAQQKLKNEFTKQQQIINQSQNKIREYENLLKKCDSHLNSTIIANDGDSIEDAKFNANNKLQKFLNYYNNNWSPIMNKAKLFENQYNLELSKYNYTDHNHYGEIKNIKITEEPKAEFSFNYDFKYLNEKEKTPNFINDFRDRFTNDIDKYYRPFRNNLVDIGDQHTILDLVYKIKLEQKKISDSKKVINSIKKRFSNVQKNIKESQKELDRRNKEKTRLQNEIANLNNKIWAQKVKDHAPLPFNTHRKNIHKAVDAAVERIAKIPETIIDGAKDIFDMICQTPQAIAEAVKFLFNKVKNGTKSLFDKIEKLLKSKKFQDALKIVGTLAIAGGAAVLFIKLGGGPLLLSKGGAILSKLGSFLGFSSGSATAGAGASAGSILSFMTNCLNYITPSFIAKSVGVGAIGLSSYFVPKQVLYKINPLNIFKQTSNSTNAVSNISSSNISTNTTNNTDLSKSIKQSNTSTKNNSHNVDVKDNNSYNKDFEPFTKSKINSNNNENNNLEKTLLGGAAGAGVGIGKLIKDDEKNKKDRKNKNNTKSSKNDKLNDNFNKNSFNNNIESYFKQKQKSKKSHILKNKNLENDSEIIANACKESFLNKRVLNDNEEEEKYCDEMQEESRKPSFWNNIFKGKNDEAQKEDNSKEVNEFIDQELISNVKDFLKKESINEIITLKEGKKVLKQINSKIELLKTVYRENKLTFTFCNEGLAIDQSIIDSNKKIKEELKRLREDRKKVKDKIKQTAEVYSSPDESLKPHLCHSAIQIINAVDDGIKELATKHPNVATTIKWGLIFEPIISGGIQGISRGPYGVLLGAASGLPRLIRNAILTEVISLPQVKDLNIWASKKAIEILKKIDPHRINTEESENACNILLNFFEAKLVQYGTQKIQGKFFSKNDFSSNNLKKFELWLKKDTKYNLKLKQRFTDEKLLNRSKSKFSNDVIQNKKVSGSDVNYNHNNPSVRNLNKKQQKFINKNSKKKTIEVPSIKKLFEKNKFGKDLKNISSKTKITEQGQRVYKINNKNNKYGLKKGDYFYLDAEHLDHLEVFDKFGKFKKVLDLDGRVIFEKTIRSQGRTINIK